MGQYYMIANLDKKQYIHPHKFGSGLKLMEFAYPLFPSMVLSALAVLLAEGNNRGGGDLCSDNPIIGSWSRDRIVVAGDYADNEPNQDKNIYIKIHDENWEDISVKILVALLDDSFFADRFREDLMSEDSLNGGFYPSAIVELAKAYLNPAEAPNGVPSLAKKAFEKLNLSNKDLKLIVGEQGWAFDF
jgi:hypothetical protein